MLNENSVDRKHGQGKGICPDSWLLSRPSASLLFYYCRASTTFKVKGNNSQKRYHALDTIVEAGAWSPAASWNSIVWSLGAFLCRECPTVSDVYSSFFTIVPKVPSSVHARFVCLSLATDDIVTRIKNHSMYFSQLRHTVLSHCSHIAPIMKQYLMWESIDSRQSHAEDTSRGHTGTI